MDASHKPSYVVAIVSGWATFLLNGLVTGLRTHSELQRSSQGQFVGDVAQSAARRASKRSTPGSIPGPDGDHSKNPNNAEFVLKADSTLHSYVSCS